MKKGFIFSIMLFLTIVISVGCSTNKSNETLLKIQDEAKIGDLSVIVKGVEYTDKISDGTFLVTAEEGNTLVMLQMEVKNNGKEDVDLGNIFTDSIGMYMELNIDGNKYEPSSSMLSNDLVSSTVNPLGKEVGIRYFEVSKDIVDQLKSITVRIERKKGSKEYFTVKLPNKQEVEDQVKKIKIGDEFMIDKFKCVINKFEFVDEISDDMWKVEAEDSEKMGQLWITVTNEGNEEKSLIDTYDSSTGLTLVYKDEYKYTFSTTLSMEKDLSNISIAPLKTEEGFTYFNVPQVISEEEGTLYIEIKNINDLQQKYIFEIR